MALIPTIVVILPLLAVGCDPPQWRMMSLVTGTAACMFLLTGYAIGVIRAGGGLAAAGYRVHSMNLLAPVDSR